MDNFKMEWTCEIFNGSPCFYYNLYQSHISYETEWVLFYELGEEEIHEYFDYLEDAFARALEIFNKENI